MASASTRRICIVLMVDTAIRNVRVASNTSLSNLIAVVMGVRSGLY